METLPTNLAADIQAANDSTPLADLVKLGVALAQARDTQHDTFQAALKLKNLIAPHMSEDPLKTLVGLKQCKTAGAASGGGVFSIMRDLDGNELEAWLDKPENLAGFAAGMEDAAAVLASPGVIHILGSIVAGWQTAIGAAPESVTEYSAAAESHRRISEAYKALIPGAQMWDDPGDVHTGLVAVMAAAKNKQLTGDPAAMAAAVVELSRGLEPMLSDPETMETLTTDREKMGAWIDSPIIMGAACSNANALEKLLASAIVIDELCKADSAGEARPGLRILLGSVIGARVFANTSLTSLKTLASSQLVMKTLVASRVAMEAVAASQVAMGAVVASQVAMGAVADSQLAMEVVAATLTALKAIVANSTACSIVEKSNTATGALQNSPLVTLVTKSTGGYGEYFYEDKCFILGFSQNWNSDSSHTNTYGDFIVGGTQTIMPATNYRQFDRINKFATGARIITTSWGGTYSYWVNGNDECGVKLIKLA